MSLLLCLGLLAPVNQFVASQDTLIAYYESLNLITNEISEVYIIYTDSVCAEITIQPGPGTYIKQNTEQRLIYNLRKKEIASIYFREEASKLVYLTSPFPQDLSSYSVKMDTSSGQDCILYVEGKQKYIMTLSDDIPNFHPLRFYYPEIATLPLRIETDVAVSTLKALITDPIAKNTIVQQHQLYLESYDVMDMEDVNDWMRGQGFTMEDLKREIQRLEQTLKKN